MPALKAQKIKNLDGLWYNFFDIFTGEIFTIRNESNQTNNHIRNESNQTNNQYRDMAVRALLAISCSDTLSIQQTRGFESGSVRNFGENWRGFQDDKKPTI